MKMLICIRKNLKFYEYCIKNINKRGNIYMISFILMYIYLFLLCTYE